MLTINSIIWVRQFDNRNVRGNLMTLHKMSVVANFALAALSFVPIHGLFLQSSFLLSLLACGFWELYCLVYTEFFYQWHFNRQTKVYLDQQGREPFKCHIKSIPSYGWKNNAIKIEAVWGRIRTLTWTTKNTNQEIMLEAEYVAEGESGTTEGIHI